MKYLKTYENYSSRVIHTLKAKAITGKNEYDVQIIQGDPRYDETNGYSYNGLVISIAGTPGSWYLASFLHNDSRNQYNQYSDYIHISGDDWLCTNGQEIIKELKLWLKNEYPIWRELKKYNL